jgi:hypothetical protein
MDREPRIGECVIVLRDSRGSDVKPGTRLTVFGIDENDSTLRGFPAGSAESSNWVPWGDVAPVRFGWDFVREHAPPDVAAILSGCDGADRIGLNHRVKLAIVATLPDLKNRILEAVHAIDAGDDDQ